MFIWKENVEKVIFSKIKFEKFQLEQLLDHTKIPKKNVSAYYKQAHTSVNRLLLHTPFWIVDIFFKYNKINFNSSLYHKLFILTKIEKNVDTVGGPEKCFGTLHWYICTASSKPSLWPITDTECQVWAQILRSTFLELILWRV